MDFHEISISFADGFSIEQTLRHWNQTRIIFHKFVSSDEFSSEPKLFQVLKSNLPVWVDDMWIRTTIAWIISAVIVMNFQNFCLLTGWFFPFVRFCYERKFNGTKREACENCSQDVKICMRRFNHLRFIIHWPNECFMAAGCHEEAKVKLMVGECL